MTIANELYKSVDVDSNEGVIKQVNDWCDGRSDVDSLSTEGVYRLVCFSDGSAASFNDCSISIVD